MSHFSAVLLVLLAGTMWAASGTAAQHFYTQSVHIPIELTQVRLFLSSALFFCSRGGAGAFGAVCALCGAVRASWCSCRSTAFSAS